MSDEKLKTSVRLPIDLIEKVRLIGYTSTTDAIIAGLELLISTAEGKAKEDKCGTTEDIDKTVEYTALERENIILKEYNETLKKELGKAEQDKEDLKTTYNNYFLQVQTLINQKAIEAPGEKKKPFWKFW
jgi:hypothetical protein